jgi:hypothetical protein
MLIGTSRRESVICPLLLVVVLCGYQIYEFEMSLRFILSLNSVCKGRKLYLHEVPDINITFAILCKSNLHRYFEIKSSGLTFEGDSGEEVTLWRLTSISHWSVVKFKSPGYFCHVSFMKISISCLLKSIVSKYFEIDILSV